MKKLLDTLLIVDVLFFDELAQIFAEKFYPIDIIITMNFRDVVIGAAGGATTPPKKLLP